MLSHFHKLNTQLKSVTTYPTVGHQHARFSARGWDSVKVWTLWQAWVDETFLSASERRALDDIEPFDEWEEFALFATHYCVVHARTGRNAPAAASPALPLSAEIPARPVAVQFDECPGVRGQRRFAAACELSGSDGNGASILNVLGLGTKARLQSCDVFSSGATENSPALTFREGGPSTRMCHSLTDLGNGSVLLAGGRGSPSSPLKDCWLFDKRTKAWTRTHDLPRPWYRHSVVALRESGLALLVGGRGATEALDGCILYSAEGGWVECEILGDKPAAVYGAVLSSVSGSAAGLFSGIYAGGLADGLISDQMLFLEADISNTKVCGFPLPLTEADRLTKPQKPTIKFTRLRISGDVEEDTARWLLTRFGASCLQHGEQLLLLGGVARDHLLSHQDEGILCSMSNGELTITGRLVNQDSGDATTIPRPLFAGHSAVLTSDGNVVVVGGGATCFSMGTFWNKGVYSWRFPTIGSDGAVASQPPPRWAHEKTVDINPVQRTIPVAAKKQSTNEAPHITLIPRVKLKTPDDFINIVRKGQPVVLEGLDLGSCVSAWTTDYLVDKVGADRKVGSHHPLLAQ